MTFVQDTVWLGTPSGIHILNKKEKKVQPSPFQKCRITSILWMNIIHESINDVWVAHSNNAISILNPDSQDEPVVTFPVPNIRSLLSYGGFVWGFSSETFRVWDAKSHTCTKTIKIGEEITSSLLVPRITTLGIWTTHSNNQVYIWDSGIKLHKFTAQKATPHHYCAACKDPIPTGKEFRICAECNTCTHTNCDLPDYVCPVDSMKPVTANTPNSTGATLTANSSNNSSSAAQIPTLTTTTSTATSSSTNVTSSPIQNPSTNPSSSVVTLIPLAASSSVVNVPSSTPLTAKPTIDQLIGIFNKNPQLATNFLVEHYFTPTSKSGNTDPLPFVAQFLRFQQQQLNPTVVGDFLGNKQNLPLLKNYTALLDFSLYDFENSLRMFLRQFNLPVEGQKICSVTDAFGDVWFSMHNSQASTDVPLFPNWEYVAKLAFGCIYANTALHNPQAKPTPMKKWVLSMCEDMPELKQELLIHLFTQIHDLPLELYDSSPTPLIQSCFTCNSIKYKPLICTLTTTKLVISGVKRNNREILQQIPFQGLQLCGDPDDAFQLKLSYSSSGEKISLVLKAKLAYTCQMWLGAFARLNQKLSTNPRSLSSSCIVNPIRTPTPISSSSPNIISSTPIIKNKTSTPPAASAVCIVSPSTKPSIPVKPSPPPSPITSSEDPSSANTIPTVNLNPRSESPAVKVEPSPSPTIRPPPDINIQACRASSASPITICTTIVPQEEPSLPKTASAPQTQAQSQPQTHTHQYSGSGSGSGSQSSSGGSHSSSGSWSGSTSTGTPSRAQSSQTQTQTPAQTQATATATVSHKQGTGTPCTTKSPPHKPKSRSRSNSPASGSSYSEYSNSSSSQSSQSQTGSSHSSTSGSGGTPIPIVASAEIRL
ncbi:Sec7 domain [Pelomyxa schiedti]|nr:Sec7 domain [Pelomyxa schiedti]